MTNLALLKRHIASGNNLKLYIKYKANKHCKMNIQAALERLDLPYRMLEFGAVEIKVHFTAGQLDQLKVILSKLGLELLDNKKAMLIEKIKNVITETVDRGEERPRENFSCYLAGQLNYDYTYLANIFSESTGTTIEQYFIAHRIERVKELLLNDKLNLTGIACRMNYSSVGHLSNQFKKVTGLTPTSFKQIRYN